MRKDLEKLDLEFYDLTESSLLSDIENLKGKKKTSKSKVAGKGTKIQLGGSVNNPVNIRERVNWLEIRLQDLERTIVLINRNLNDLRHDFDEKIGKLGNHEKIPEEVRNELSSLKSIVERNMSVSEELKTKMPVFLRKLEQKVNEIDEKMKKNEEKYLDSPVIIE